MGAAAGAGEALGVAWGAAGETSVSGICGVGVDVLESGVEGATGALRFLSRLLVEEEQGCTCRTVESQQGETERWG